MRKNLPPKIAEQLESDFELEREERSFEDGSSSSSKGNTLFLIRLKGGTPTLVSCRLKHKFQH